MSKSILSSLLTSSISYHSIHVLYKSYKSKESSIEDLYIYTSKEQDIIWSRILNILLHISNNIIRKESILNRLEKGENNNYEYGNISIEEAIDVIEDICGIIKIALEYELNKHEKADKKIKTKKLLSLHQLIQVIHDLMMDTDLIILEKWQNILNSISKVLELYVHLKKDDWINVLPNTILFLIMKSNGDTAKISDIKRLETLRDTFSCFDLSHEDSEMLRNLFLQSLINPLFITSNEGRRVLTHAFISGDMIELMHATIKEQIPAAKAPMLIGFGELYLSIWLHNAAMPQSVNDGLNKSPIYSVMSECAYYSVYAATSLVSNNFSKVCAAFASKRSFPGVENLLNQLYSPFILRSLQAPNPFVRCQGVKSMVNIFPLLPESSDKNERELESEKAEFVNKQLNLIETLLTDDEIAVRVASCSNFARIIGLYWNIIPEHLTKKYLNGIVSCCFDTSSSSVRVSALQALNFLLNEQPKSHRLIGSFFAKLSELLNDKTEAVRSTVILLYFSLRSLNASTFFNIVPIESLLSHLAYDTPKIASKVISLLVPHYIVLDDPAVLVTRVISLCENQDAARNFFKYLSAHVGVKSCLMLICILLNSMILQITDKNNEETSKLDKGKKRKVVSNHSAVDNAPLMNILLNGLTVLWQKLNKKDAEYDEFVVVLLESVNTASIKQIQVFYSEDSEACNGIKQSLKILEAFLPSPASGKKSKNKTEKSIDGLLQEVVKLPANANESNFSLLVECIANNNQIDYFIKILLENVQNYNEADHSSVYSIESSKTHISNCLTIIDYIISSKAFAANVCQCYEVILKSLQGFRELVENSISSNFTSDNLNYIRTGFEIYLKFHISQANGKIPDAMVEVIDWAGFAFPPLLENATVDSEPKKKVSKGKKASVPTIEGFQNLDYVKKIGLFLLHLTSDALSIGLLPPSRLSGSIMKILSFVLRDSKHPLELVALAYRFVFQYSLHDYFFVEGIEILDFALYSTPSTFTKFGVLKDIFAVLKSSHYDYVTKLLGVSIDMQYKGGKKAAIPQSLSFSEELNPFLLTSCSIMCTLPDSFSSFVSRTLLDLEVTENSKFHFSALLSLLKLLSNFQLYLTKNAKSNEKVGIDMNMVKSLAIKAQEFCNNKTDEWDETGSYHRKDVTDYSNNLVSLF